jgi:uncharacterized protein with FMN-binding domain
MHRAAAAVAATVVCLWLVLTFKSSPLPRSDAATASTTTTTTSSARSGTQPPAGPAPPPGSVPTTAAPPTNIRAIDGDVESTRYGEVQVEVVLNGGRIVDVRALQLPFDRPRSQNISDQAAPLLHDEVLRAQSARIDTIGGATYTSDGYVLSLQSALDRA